MTARHLIKTCMNYDMNLLGVFSAMLIEMNEVVFSLDTLLKMQIVYTSDLQNRYTVKLGQVTCLDEIK